MQYPDPPEPDGVTNPSTRDGIAKVIMKWAGNSFIPVFTKGPSPSLKGG